MNDNNLHIRTATPADTEELLTVYEPYVLKTAITLEYVVPTAEESREQIAHMLTRFLYLAAAQDGRAVGYAYASPLKSQAAYDWAVETSIYVDETYRGGGVGTRLYRALEDISRQQNILNLEAYIAYPNPESIRFHGKYGYKAVTHFTKCGYRVGIWYDMIWMEKMLGGHPKGPVLVIPITSEVPKNLF